MGESESSGSETGSVTTTTAGSTGQKTASQQTFIVPYRHMLSEHAVKGSLLVFDDAVQDDPRHHREEVRLLGIVGGAHAEINQLKAQHKLKHTPSLWIYSRGGTVCASPLTWMRLLASRAMLEKCGTLLRSCGSLLKHTSMPSSSLRMVHTHSSLLGGALWGAELSCCRASFSASSLHSRHSWWSSSFNSEF